MAVNVLLSYAFHAKTDLGVIRRNLVCGRLMIDSGAFSAYTSGAVIDRAEYADFLRRWWGCWDHAITLDAIGDPATTRANTRWLHEQGLPVMPVFTPGDKLPDFDAMVREHGYVCVGGLVGLAPRTQRARVRMLQQRAQRAGGGIHALGIGGMDTLRATRPYSADSSTVTTATRFENLVYFDGHHIRQTNVGNRARLCRDWDRIRAHGIDLADITRAGKLPGSASWSSLFRSMSVGFVVGDERLKRVPTPAPQSIQRDGPHLYIAVTKVPSWARAISSLDRDLHSDDVDPPPLWAQHAHLHTCHANERTADDAAS